MTGGSAARLDINSICESGTSIVSWYACDGHVDRSAFLAELQAEWDLVADADKVQYVYWHFIPTANDWDLGYYETYYRPGRGRKPVTQIEAKDCKAIDAAESAR